MSRVLLSVFDEQAQALLSLLSGDFDLVQLMIS